MKKYETEISLKFILQKVLFPSFALAINQAVPKSLECPYTNPPPLTSSHKRSWSIVLKPIKWITKVSTALITGCGSYTTAAFWQTWRMPIYASSSYSACFTIPNAEMSTETPHTAAERLAMHGLSGVFGSTYLTKWSCHGSVPVSFEQYLL